MGLRDRALGALVTANNDHIRSVEGTMPNPRSLDDLTWHRLLAARTPEIRQEWQAFVDVDGRTPRIEQVLDESQGNDGDWRFGLLVVQGRTTAMGAHWFPRTIAALSEVDGLRAAMFSVLAPGTSLPEHHGPNAGVLRYHLGIDCGAGASLEVNETTVAYRDGEGVLFDDTVPHSARNDGPSDRVTLFCEIARPLPLRDRWRNAAVQRIIGLDPRYRRAVARADRWYEALNPTLPR